MGWKVDGPRNTDSELLSKFGVAIWCMASFAGTISQLAEQSYGLSDLNKNKADGPSVVD